MNQTLTHWFIELIGYCKESKQISYKQLGWWIAILAMILGAPHLKKWSLFSQSFHVDCSCDLL